MRFFQKLRRRRQLDRDLEDELQFHLDMGRDRKQFGNVALVKERCREMWTFTLLESWWQDIHYAIRTLRHSPSVSAVAVLALAVGIGVNTLVFTVVSSALSFDFGVVGQDRLVTIQAANPAVGNAVLSLPGLMELRSKLKSIDVLAGYRMFPVNLSDGAALPERFRCVQMSVSGFALMARKPVLGRSFVPGDELPEAPAVVMLTDGVWQDRYARDPAVVGKVIRVDETPRTIVGVMPPGIRFPEDTDIWIPLTPNDLLAGARPLLFGRLAPGLGAPAARAEIDALARNLLHQAPGATPGFVADVRPMLELIGIYSIRKLLYAMLAAVAFVLLIACADVANLLLGRAAERWREISIRVAIGAARGRIIRQLLVESALLSLTGGACGALLAFAGLRWFDRFSAAMGRPSWIDFSMNGKVLLYLTAISLGAGILFGLAPALRLAKVDVNSGIKDGGLGAAGGWRNRRLAGSLVVFEMMLCVVLLAGAGLLIRTCVNVYNAPLGVNASNVLTMHLNLPQPKYPRPEDQILFHRRLSARIAALPDVETVALASNLPTAGALQVHAQLESYDLPGANALVVSPGYFRALQVNLLRGRTFAEQPGAPEAVVNTAFASKYWPGENPIGKRVRVVAGAKPLAWMTVAGLVAEIQQNGRQPTDRLPILYVPYSELPQRIMFLMARTRVAPASLTSTFRRQVQSLDENLAVYDAGTLQERVTRTRLNFTSFGVLFSIFASMALLLAFAGLYGVMAHSVSRRVREIGVRMALGGTERHIMRMVYAQGLRQVGLGLMLGLPAALAVSRILRGTLIGVAPGDPVTFVGVIVVLLIAGALGCAIPARRAVRVDPIDALRHE